MTWKTACPVGADTNRTEQRTWNTTCPVAVNAERTTCAAQADESEGFSYSHGRLRPCRVIIVRYMYILDEDAEDTEDADDDRSSFHSSSILGGQGVKITRLLFFSATMFIDAAQYC